MIASLFNSASLTMLFAATTAQTYAQLQNGSLGSACQVPNNPIECNSGLLCARPDGVGAESPGLCVRAGGSVAILGGSCGGFMPTNPRCFFGLTCQLGDISDAPGVCVHSTTATATATESATLSSPAPSIFSSAPFSGSTAVSNSTNPTSGAVSISSLSGVACMGSLAIALYATCFL
ncbi:hypothetical protein QVD99_001701 [Batrachochytrium dendrobatidis]|nr:hypothetical protein O5D80_000348 [Batrachochytrium dendrobatidis]KAK5671875.1 hypothetical protein QVD99_001701 [Batrachochytrium dendrobatidis]